MAASAIAAISWRFRSLTAGGAASAVVVGTVAVTAGWDWGILLLVYYAANILVSRIGLTRKNSLLVGIVAKAEARDQMQVVANGFAFLTAALAHIVSASALAMVAGGAALAASTADTWATELGTLSRSRPRLLLTGRQVAPGESGGVTVAGCAAALAGSALVSVVAISLGWPSPVCTAIAVGGMVGAVTDSILGAALQHKFWCSACNTVTEREVHSCGAQTMHHSGVPWVNNDTVNLLSTATGAGVALLIALGMGAGGG